MASRYTFSRVLRRATPCALSRPSLACGNIYPAHIRATPASQPQCKQYKLGQVRWHSAPASKSKAYEFADIQNFTKHPSPERVIIDVREPNEYEAGYIPTAHNMPIKTQPDAIFLPADEFEDRLGFDKPRQDQEVVFYCRSGVRSNAAAGLAQQAGYEKIGEYRGSWLDWEKQGGERGGK